MKVCNMIISLHYTDIKNPSARYTFACDPIVEAAIHLVAGVTLIFGTALSLMWKNKNISIKTKT